MIKNLTPHSVDIHTGKTIISFLSCGTVPRCQQSEEVSFTLEGIPVTKQVFGQVFDLPEKEEGVYLIVSRLVASACPERDDLLVPGPMVRGEDGRPVGCKGLSLI